MSKMSELDAPDAGDAIPTKVPWEQPVREVTLAAQVGAVDEMSHNWYLMSEGVHAYAVAFDGVYKNRLKEWTGEAADAARQKWTEVAEKINSVAKNYGSGGPTGAGVPGSLSVCARQIYKAISSIPIPTFGHSAELPAGSSDSNPGGKSLYADYDIDRGAYHDFAFRNRALRGKDSPGGTNSNMANSTQTRSNDGSYVRRDSYGNANRNDIAGNVEALANGDYEYVQRVNTWYNTNSKTATDAWAGLKATYATHEVSLPKPALGWFGSLSHQTPPPPPHNPYGSSGGAGGAGGAGMPSLGSVPGTSAVPDHGSGSADSGLGSSALDPPGDTPGSRPGSGLAGIGDGTELPGTEGSRFGAGFIGGDVPSVRSDESRNPLGGMMPVGSLPTDPVGPRSSISGSSKSSGAGMGPGMVGSGARGGARSRDTDRDGSRGWLVEDEDVWGTHDFDDVLPPGGVIGGDRG